MQTLAAAKNSTETTTINSGLTNGNSSKIKRGRKNQHKTKTYLDVLIETSRFPEFRWKPAFTEYIFSNFLNEAAAKCLEIKTKYKILGQPLTPETVVEACCAENISIDWSEELKFDSDTAWFRTNESNEKFIWVNDNLPLDKAQSLMIDCYAALSIPKAAKIIINDKSGDKKDLKSLVKNTELMRAVLTVELLNALLRSSESEAELIFLQNQNIETYSLHRRYLESLTLQSKARSMIQIVLESQDINERKIKMSELITFLCEEAHHAFFDLGEQLVKWLAEPNTVQQTAEIVDIRKGKTARRSKNNLMKKKAA